MQLTRMEGLAALGDILERGTLIPVITDDTNLGSAVPMGLPNSADLAKRLLEKLPQELRDMFPVRSASLVPLIAEHYASHFGLPSLLILLEEQFGNVNARTSEVQRLVLNLPTQSFVSTSIGHSILNALKAINTSSIRVYVSSEDVQETNTGQSLFKIFGCIGQRQTIAITRQDIENLKRSSQESLIRKLKEKVALSSLLIVSPDLDGWQVNALHDFLYPMDRWTQSRYILIEESKRHDVALWESRGYRIIQADVSAFLRSLEPMFRQQSTDLRRKTRDPRHPDLQSPPREPYKFLDYFTEDDYGIFFGREQEITSAIVNACAERWSLITGESGLGKTSVIQAAVIPELRARGYLALYVRVLDEPLFQLATEITKLGTWETETKVPVDSEPLTIVRHFLLNAAESDKPVAILLDQFEETFVRLGIETRQKFLTDLDTLSKSFANVSIVLSIRSDFMYKVLETILGASLRLSAVTVLKRFTTTQALCAILEPAKLCGITVEDGVVSRIIKDLDKEGIEPAQLSIVCFSLYSASRADKIISLELYDKMGGTVGILGDYLDHVLNDLSVPSQKEVAKAILKVLVSEDRTRFAVTVREVGRDYLVRSLEADANEISAVIDYLIDRRIIRFIEEKADFIELSHETLVHKIWSWVTTDDIERKFTRSLLHRAIGDWRQFQIHPRREHWEAISKLKSRIEFDRDEILLMLKSALTYGEDVNYWVHCAEAVGFSIASELESTMNSSDPDSMLHALIWATKEDSGAARQVIESALASDCPALARRASRHIQSSKSGATTANIQDPFERKEIINVPAGKFTMGIVDERFPYSGPEHEVYVDAFGIFRYPVTNYEYQRYVLAGGGRPPKHWKSGEPPDLLQDHPVTHVSWIEACEFCLWLGKLRGQAYRLPSAAEWEKAAGWNESSSTRSIWSWGDVFDPSRANTRIGGPGKTTPIGQYSAKGGDSPYGASDMCGNTFDWVLDWSASSYEDVAAVAKKPGGPAQGTQKVARGGSWAGSPEGASVVANSYALLPGIRNEYVGFRLVLTNLTDPLLLSMQNQLKLLC